MDIPLDAIRGPALPGKSTIVALAPSMDAAILEALTKIAGPERAAGSLELVKDMMLAAARTADVGGLGATGTVEHRPR